MDTESLSSTAAIKAGSFITETSAHVTLRRGEEILGLPAVKDKRWNVEVTISPAEAKAILLAMPTQRVISEANVRFFVDLIRSGRFHWTHQGIAFDENGGLMDGMHRMLACVKADRSIVVQVTFNMPRELFNALDRGKARSLADDLVTGGLVANKPQSEALATAARVLFQLDRGRAPWETPDKNEFQLAEMAQVIERHPAVMDSVDWTYQHRRCWRGLGMGAAAGFYTAFRERNAGKADLFMEQIALGEDLRHGDPGYAFREYKRDLGPNGGKYRRQTILIVLVRCWNAFVEDRLLLKASSQVKGELNFPAISKGK
jgi:hypothetical protein